MVKTFVSMVCVGILLFFAGIYENLHIKREFEEFNSQLTVLYQKIEDQTATTNDVLAIQNNWLEKKSDLHAFISHAEIREVELWVSETITLVQKKSWVDALSKVEVLIDLSEQIPKNFLLRIENIL